MAKIDIIKKVVLKGFKGVLSRKKFHKQLRLLSFNFFYIRKKLILTMKIIEGDCYKLKFQDEAEKFEGAN